MSSPESIPPREEGLRELRSLRTFVGEAPAFWLRFAEGVRLLSGARQARVLASRDGQWSVLAMVPEGRAHPRAFWRDEVETLLAGVWSGGQMVEHLTSTGEGSARHLFVPLLTEDTQIPCLLELVGGAELDGGAVHLIADTPAIYQRNRAALRWRHEAERLERALDLLAVVNAHHHFSPASMALVNEVASRLEADRVTLGWLAFPYIKVVAVSGTDRFQRKMQALQQLEAAMEECRDQDEEILWPDQIARDAVTRDHAEYARQAGSDSLLSVPLRYQDEVVGVLTVEREKRPFSEPEILALRVIGDQCTPRLADLRESSRWFGYRWAKAARKFPAKLLGPRHTWWKLAAVLTSLVLLFAVLVPFPYRASATFLIRAESLAHLPAPFDGFIAEAPVRPGDLVEAGTVVARLEDRDLLIERAETRAEILRFQAESEMAEATGRLADMRVARASLAQSRARLELIEDRLERASLRTPFAGVVVQGDLRERIGAPVNQGEVLFQVSEMAGLFLEIRLPERDIDLIEGFTSGRVVFASRPDVKFPIEVERVSPAAYADEQGNAFFLRAYLEEEADWLRPGMSGVAKIDAGNRTLAWRATHRIIDFLRMRFWW